MTEEPWKPTFIDIEKEFTNFVNSFRDGQTVEQAVAEIPKGVLNADFVFQVDQVIAELKCLKEDASDSNKRAERLAKAYVKTEHTGSDLMGYLWRGEPMPDAVRQRLFNVESRSMCSAILKANKQIRATKRLLRMDNARGLVLVANDQNFGFSPRSITKVVCDSFKKMKDCHVDCIVYFTPNVYHDMGDDIARTVWIPIYNVGSEDFGDFVNELGFKWHDFTEQFGEPYISREVGDDLFDQLVSGHPIKAFKNSS